MPAFWVKAALLLARLAEIVPPVEVYELPVSVPLLIVTLRSEIADHGFSGLIIRAFASADLLWCDACTSDGHTPDITKTQCMGQSERNAI